MVFSKSLHFRYENLPQAGTLIYTFDDAKIVGHQMYNDFFPVAWKVVPLQMNGRFQFPITFKQEFAFMTASIEHGKVVTSAAVRDIDFKQTTALRGNDKTGYEWDEPKSQTTLGEKEFAGTNNTGSVQNIAVCTNTSKFAEPVLLLKVPAGGTAQVRFTGKLRIYAINGMEEGTVLTTQVTSPLLWEQDIASEDLQEDWVVSFDNKSGNYVFKPDSGRA